MVDGIQLIMTANGLQYQRTSRILPGGYQKTDDVGHPDFHL